MMVDVVEQKILVHVDVVERKILVDLSSHDEGGWHGTKNSCAPVIMYIY
jgi:hypothetical protein